jgi:hypothetical protein
MEQELRQGDEKVQCKAASACWKVAYSDPDCRNSLGLVLLPDTSHLTPHTSHLTPHSSHLTAHTSHLTPYTSHLTPHTLHLTPHTSHLAPHTSHLTPHTSHLTLQVVIAALVDSLKVGYVPLQERASGALATLSSR